jgi:hypothetical protein
MAPGITFACSRTSRNCLPKIAACRDERNPGKLVTSYRVEARSDSLCGALFCRVLTR